VQHQPNGNDCGVFTIAFAISLLFNIKPEKVRYNHSLMRSHLIKIFETNVIEHFPQDPQYALQKVLPLAVVKARKFAALRIRSIRQCETEQQKLNRLEKICNTYRYKKELNNNQLQLSTENVLKEIKETTNKSYKKTECSLNKIYIKNNIDCEINSNDLYSNKTNSITFYEKQTSENKDFKNKCTKNRFTSEDNVQLENINKKEYQHDLKNNKRARYIQDLENNLIKQDSYMQKLENNRAKRHERYKKKLENERAQIRYKQNLWVYSVRFSLCKLCNFEKCKTVTKTLFYNDNQSL